MLLFSGIIAFSILLLSEAASNFSIGDTLAIAGSTTPSLVQSNNGLFTFGFVAAEGNIGFGIWYVSDPRTFLVWKPPLSSGTTIIRGAMAELSTSDGNLRLYSASRNSVVWSSGNTAAAVRGSLNDSGALLLHASNGTTVWSSFDHPSDTLLPNQFLLVGGVLQTSQYNLRLESSGNLSLLWNNSLVYWSGRNQLEAARLDDNGVLNLLSNASDLTSYVRRFFGFDYGSGQTRRLTLDSDGNLRIYTLSQQSGWSAQWSALEDQCQVYGYCGPFGVCSYDKDSSPGCSCPPGFSPIDRTRSRSGCSSPAAARSCNAGETGSLVQMNRTRWLLTAFGPSSSQQQLAIGSNTDACKLQCQTDPACFACMGPADGSENCIQFRSSYLSAFSHPFLASAAYVKVCTVGGAVPEMVSPSESECTSASRTAGISVAVTIVAVGIAEVLLFLGLRSWQRKRRKSRPVESRGGGVYTSGSPIRFTYRELQIATRNFSERIGGGGFGTVYKGVLVLDDGAVARRSWSRSSVKMNVAVKKLEGVLQGDKEFRAEVAAIGSTHHVNLMHLVGFCSKGDSRILVYEFMPNGSLDFLIFSAAASNTTTSSGRMTNTSISSGSLVNTADFDDRHEWKTRMGIAIGTAKGVAYLHEECRDCIVHCDLKPDNILLDGEFCPKVSDFGLAKMMMPRHENSPEITSQSLTSVRGTRGYLAPEWLLPNAAITSKADVFSYGVILIELVTGKRSADERNLLRWVFHEMDFDARAVLDPRVVDVDVEQLERMLRVAFWCLQDAPANRPSMSKVVNMLEATLPVPRSPMPRNIDRSV